MTGSTRTRLLTPEEACDFARDAAERLRRDRLQAVETEARLDRRLSPCCDCEDHLCP